MLLNHNTDGDFALRLLQIPKIITMMEQALDESENTIDHNKIILFAIYKALKPIHEWLKNENRLSAEREAEIILSLVSRVFPHQK